MKIMSYALFCLLLISSSSFACRCKEPSIDQSYKNSSMVVYASVQDYIPSPSNEGGTAVVLVSEWWKSTSPKKIVVNSLTNCGFNFETGKNYLLFLNQEPSGLFYTDMCSGNKALKLDDQFSRTLKNIKSDVSVVDK